MLPSLLDSLGAWIVGPHMLLDIFFTASETKENNCTRSCRDTLLLDVSLNNTCLLSSKYKVRYIMCSLMFEKKCLSQCDKIPEVPKHANRFSSFGVSQRSPSRFPFTSKRRVFIPHVVIFKSIQLPFRRLKYVPCSPVVLIVYLNLPFNSPLSLLFSPSSSSRQNEHQHYPVCDLHHQHQAPHF
ncbi:hypothetical protein P154DRAFT_74597 [Amniculicola lignicola CBS 123094]|uniref:Uncharacterized protein n=1 Tax=Amniculicola lignicola CBS 123094 TaxID=1392246 RepID=A0A6A5VX20_9PLEO|nr:hypothetical protein P154DRAFT_74597 [Amniculicola lignicola CBS 123094]